jgi:KTSC domain
MNRIRVAEGRSRQVKSFGYDKASQVLEIEFSSGGVYDYAAVPENVYQEFIKAESLGSFIANRIRGAFEYTRLHVPLCISPDVPGIEPTICPCWCHKVRKDVSSHGETIPNPDLSKELRKSIKQAKAKKSA